VDGEYLRIGEVLKRAKNSNRADTISINARKFLLIGDPSMKLAIPEYDISTTSINGKPASEVDTLKALQKVEVSGEILDYDGSIKSDFSGTIFPTVFDKATTQRTLANDPRSFERNFEVQRNVIFKGSATVTNGKFSFSFVIPIDINYDFGNGKISYYAQSDNSEDAGGFFNQLIIGGTDSTALADDKGPTIELFMNNESFAFGGITNSEPTLIAKISDDNGINISGTSIGHDITGLLDQNTQNSFILNDFYTAQKDDFTQGIVRFPLTDIEEGVHQIRVKAFDIANNAGEGYTEFVVVNNLQSGINRLINYPNPFTTKTTFSFEHGYVNSLLDVQLDIYTVSGKVIKTIQTSEFSDGFRMSGIEWDGKDDFGNSLGRGIYLYKVKIFNKDLNISTESAFEKLVLLN